MSDSPTCKQQKTVKKEEAPNSVLSLLKEILHYCIAFVGKGHYQFVGSICKKINKIYANEDEDMKTTIWSNVTISKDLAELCLQDHQKLGRTQDDVWEMVDEIRKLAAKLGNEEVLKWAIQNDFYFMELFEDDDLFLDVAKKGHLRVLEKAHSNRLQWYSREILDDAAARFDVELLYFIFNRKPNKTGCIKTWLRDISPMSKKRDFAFRTPIMVIQMASKTLRDFSVAAIFSVGLPARRSI
jgi:hypothetical protein